jgi:hypothetical protein
VVNRGPTQVGDSGSIERRDIGAPVALFHTGYSERPQCRMGCDL